MSQDAPEITTQQRFNRVHDDLDTIYTKARDTADRLQDAETARVRAERVIGVIAQSSTGNYEWCRRLCCAYLDDPSRSTEALLDAAANGVTEQEFVSRVREVLGCGPDTSMDVLLSHICCHKGEHSYWQGVALSNRNAVDVIQSAILSRSNP